MPRLTPLFALALVSIAPPSHAESHAEAVREPPEIRWDFGARIGYASPWTTAQSFLEAGTGLAAGATFPLHIRLELGVIYHVGTTVSAENASTLYWSRQWSMLGHAAAGYELAMFSRRFVVRPRLLAAGLFVSDTTQLGAERRSGIEPFFAFGPAADVLVRFGALHAGIDARALFVPSRVAAPMGGLYGIFGLEQ
jgi:hypothetical protein